MARLIITADDYGYHPRYDEGILRAAETRAVDAVSAFALRQGLGPERLLATGVEIGLHLELDGTAVAEQAGIFTARFERPPAYLDGHRHVHAAPTHAAAVARFAAAHELPVRSVNPAHRRLLRAHGVATPDLLIGRLAENEPALPVELRGSADSLPAVTEWFVHPGLSAGEGSSRYDAGREEDLALLLDLALPSGVARATHEILRSC